MFIGCILHNGHVINILEIQYIWPKMNPIKKSQCIYGFSFLVMFFVLFLGLSSDKIHRDNISSKGTVSLDLSNNPIYGI